MPFADVTDQIRTVGRILKRRATTTCGPHAWPRMSTRAWRSRPLCLTSLRWTGPSSTCTFTARNRPNRRGNARNALALVLRQTGAAAAGVGAGAAAGGLLIVIVVPVTVTPGTLTTTLITLTPNSRMSAMICSIVRPGVPGAPCWPGTPLQTKNTRSSAEPGPLKTVTFTPPAGQFRPGGSTTTLIGGPGGGAARTCGTCTRHRHGGDDGRRGDRRGDRRRALRMDRRTRTPARPPDPAHTSCSPPLVGI